MQDLIEVFKIIISGRETLGPAVGEVLCISNKQGNLVTQIYIYYNMHRPT